jgi:hypothetical protein
MYVFLPITSIQKNFAMMVSYSQVILEIWADVFLVLHV